MNQQIQRLENDIENFPKTQDEHDKFVEKMSISFLHVYTADINVNFVWLSISQHLKLSFKSLLPCFYSSGEKSMSEYAECKKTRKPLTKLNLMFYS